MLWILLSSSPSWPILLAFYTVGTVTRVSMMSFVSVHKLSVQVCEEDDGKPLQVAHLPAMSAEESRKVGLAIRVRNM